MYVRRKCNKLVFLLCKFVPKWSSDARSRHKVFMTPKSKLGIFTLRTPYINNLDALYINYTPSYERNRENISDIIEE